MAPRLHLSKGAEPKRILMLRMHGEPAQDLLHEKAGERAMQAPPPSNQEALLSAWRQ